MNLRKVVMKNGSLVIFIRLNSAEIWGFKYGLMFGIGVQKYMARTGVFVSVVRALKRSIISAPHPSCTILT
jgi:hypothetical protein